MRQNNFSKDFFLVAAGQIISLFGNAIIRFALPLYLLNQTGSPALYGAVTACAFLPSILLSPVGGIVADRVNKRNIMVALDFSTAVLILLFSLSLGRGNLILPLVITLMLLYGIAGAYQPSVQASIPALVGEEQLMAANSVINMISSLASLLGPVLGGILYSIYGLMPVLWVCMVCFTLSAGMELFIHIPFARQETESTVWKTVKKDFSESMHLLFSEKPVLLKGLLVVCGINLFLSAMIVVGLPYLVTEVLPFEAETANRLYGFAQGALGAGGLAGGVCAGIFAKRLPVQKSGNLLSACAGCVFPMAFALLLGLPGVWIYGVITLCCFLAMIFSTIFTVQILSFVQRETPPHLIGKVISVILTVSMCAHPLGAGLYGVLFEACGGSEWAVVLFSGVVSLAIAVGAVSVFRKLQAVQEAVA